MIAVLALKLMELLSIDAKPARRIAWVVVIVVGALLTLGAVKAYFAIHDANVVENHEAKTSAKLERSGRKADASAAQRAEARRRVEATAREDFNNAANGIPDHGLTARQRLDICRELLDAGTDPALIPECGDVRTGAKTRP